MWVFALAPLALLPALQTASAVPEQATVANRKLGTSVLEVLMEGVPGVTGSDSFAQCAAGNDLTPLSYSAKLAPQYDAIPVVMESVSGTCDAFSKDFCNKFAAGKTSNVPVDTCIMSTIHGFLADCEGKRTDVNDAATRCNVMDVGANMGTMTSNMLAAGAHVTAIEPQRDLAELVWATACLNGWGKRLRLYGNAVTADGAEAGASLALGNREKAGKWGFRPDGAHLKKTAKTFEAKKVWLEQAVGETKKWSYVKIDTDAIDDALTHSFLKMIDAGKVEVTTFQVEEPKAEICHLMQSRHGYSMYITVNPHTQFKPKPDWESSGKITSFTQGVGPVGGRKWPVKLWKIGPMDLGGWQEMLSKQHIRVINMLMTKEPSVVGDMSAVAAPSQPPAPATPPPPPVVATLPPPPPVVTTPPPQAALNAPAPNSLDLNPEQCPLWAQRGDCATNAHWMCVNCRGSCTPSCTQRINVNLASTPDTSVPLVPGISHVEIQSFCLALFGIALVVKLAKRLK